MAEPGEGRPAGIHDPRDFVHIEIATALRRKIRVIPALVDGARMPDESELPEPLQGLARRQAIRLSHERFAADGQGLVKALQEVLHIGLDGGGSIVDDMPSR